MNDVSTYHLRLRGYIDQDDLNTMGPLQVTVEPVEAALVRIVVRTDQSGLIGLLRHLHAHGIIILALHRDPG
jgi:hypothetical protein